MTDNFAADFMRGQLDCREGKPHQQGESEAYDRGYGTEYQADQINTAITALQLSKIKQGEIA